MMKNVLKLFMMLMLLTGVCFAQDFEKYVQNIFWLKLLQKQSKLKKQLMTGEILNIMQEHIQCVHRVKTAVT